MLPHSGRLAQRLWITSAAGSSEARETTSPPLNARERLDAIRTSVRLCQVWRPDSRSTFLARPTMCAYCSGAEPSTVGGASCAGTNESSAGLSRQRYPSPRGCQHRRYRNPDGPRAILCHGCHSMDPATGGRDRTVGRAGSRAPGLMGRSNFRRESHLSADRDGGVGRRGARAGLMVQSRSARPVLDATLRDSDRILSDRRAELVGTNLFASVIFHASPSGCIRTRDRRLGAPRTRRAISVLCRYVPPVPSSSPGFAASPSEVRAHFRAPSVGAGRAHRWTALTQVMPRRCLAQPSARGRRLASQWSTMCNVRFNG
jgi:hypothetical protein